MGLNDPKIPKEKDGKTQSINQIMKMKKEGDKQKWKPIVVHKTSKKALNKNIETKTMVIRRKESNGYYPLIDKMT